MQHHRRFRSLITATVSSTLLITASVFAPPALATDPALTASPVLTIESAAFTPGSDWGSGIAVSASGLTPATEYSLVVYWNEDDVVVGYDTRTEESDSNGDLTVDGWSPPFPPASLKSPTEGYRVALSGPDMDMICTPLPVIRERGVQVNASRIDATTLADPQSTFWISAAGFTPGEAVSTSAQQSDGAKPVLGGEGSAAVDTSVTLYRIAVTAAQPGPLQLTVTGAQSGLAQSITLQVNQNGVVTPPTEQPTIPPPPTTTQVDPSAATEPPLTTPRRLPVVSG